MQLAEIALQAKSAALCPRKFHGKSNYPSVGITLPRVKRERERREDADDAQSVRPTACKYSVRRRESRDKVQEIKGSKRTRDAGLVFFREEWVDGGLG